MVWYETVIIPVISVGLGGGTEIVKGQFAR